MYMHIIYTHAHTLYSYNTKILIFLRRFEILQSRFHKEGDHGKKIQKKANTLIHDIAGGQKQTLRKCYCIGGLCMYVYMYV